MAKYIKEYASKAGLKVVNAKHDLVVSVTKGDVDKGAQKDSECCAIARAVMKQNSGAARVFIFKSKAYVETAMNLTRYNLPVSVQKEVVSFDRFKLMEPGVYKLQAPPKSQAPKARREEYKRKKAGKTKAGKSKHITTGVRTGLRETTK